MLRDSPQNHADSLETIEAAILPTVSGMLDAMLEAASLARAGCDAEHYAEALRSLTLELEAVTHEVEAMAALASVTGYPSPSDCASSTSYASATGYASAA
jgi:hypothetical protein